MLKEIGECGFTVKDFFTHSSESRYKAPLDLRGKQLNAFIDSIVGVLTYDFRYELSILTEKECSEIAFQHYLRIKNV